MANITYTHITPAILGDAILAYNDGIDALAFSTTGPPPESNTAGELIGGPGVWRAILIDGELAAMGSLERINWIDRVAEIGGYVVPKWRAKGLSKVGMGHMIDLARKRLGLRRVYTYILQGNSPAIRCTEALGFRLEGTLKGHRLVNGRPVDVLVYGLILEG